MVDEPSRDELRLRDDILMAAQETGVFIDEHTTTLDSITDPKIRAQVEAILRRYIDG